MNIASSWTCERAQARRSADVVVLDFRLFFNTGTYTGTAQHVCTLPDAWRPAETTTCAVVAMDSGTGMGVGHLTVNANGTVVASTTFPGARWAIGSVAYLR